MRRLGRSILTILASVFVALQLGVMSAAAQQGNGLQIQPPRTELTIERGSADAFEVTLKNISDQPVIARSAVNDFESDGVTGDPRIIVDSNIVSDSSLRDFLVDLEDVPLEGNESKTFRVSLQVPEAAAPGAYYGLIRYQAVHVDADGEALDAQFSLNASLGVLVLLEVPGEVAQGAEVVSLSAQNVDLDDAGNAVSEPKSKSIFTGAPQQIAVEVKNTGGTFIKPFGKVIVTNMLGSETANYEMNSTNPRGNVLPGSSRLFTDQIDVGGVGRYTIEANIAYTQGGEVITRTTVFWVLPIWLILAVVALVALAAGLGYRGYRKYFA